VIRQLLMSLGLCCLCTPAWTQQAVTAAELAGTVMEVSSTNSRVLLRDGRRIPYRYKIEWTIYFLSDDMITATFIGTDYTARGVKKTPVERGGLIKLARPNETRSRGGGHQVWVFEDGALTYLRTYLGGAMKAIFSVTRKGGDFACTTSVEWLREEGVPSIVMRSPHDKSRVEIVSTRQTASSCKIRRAR
jgi:hypothetical protein